MKNSFFLTCQLVAGFVIVQINDLSQPEKELVTMKQSVNHQRLWEIDVTRGIALVLMITYHLLYDLKEFFGFNIAFDQGWFYLLGKAAAVLFILLAGISAAFSQKNPSRGLKLMGWGGVIFLVTSLAVPGSNIVFGILQFLGVCLLLYPLFKNIAPYLMATLGTAIILSGDFATQITMHHNWLAPLGFRTPSFSSVDYFPLLPWWGVFLWGVALSKLLYKQKKSLFKTADQLFQPLATVGRHTLIIYLLHQPILLVVLYLSLDPQGFLNMFRNIF